MLHLSETCPVLACHMADEACRMKGVNLTIEDRTTDDRMLETLALPLVDTLYAFKELMRL